MTKNAKKNDKLVKTSLKFSLTRKKMILKIIFTFSFTYNCPLKIMINEMFFLVLITIYLSVAFLQPRITELC